MKGFKKTDIQTHTDGGYGTYYPAVNVKHHGSSGLHQAVMEKFGCSDSVAEKALEYAWESACRSFWEYWQDTTGDLENGLYGSPEYAYFPGYKVRVYSAGRSGGWLIVQGLPPVEEWDAIAVNRWAKFQKDVKADVEYRLGKEQVLEDIEANRWAEEGAELYNFTDTKKGTFSIVDIKKDVNAYAEEKFGIKVM